MSRPETASRYLADLTWFEAAEVLTPDAVVLIPLGAAAKQHGPHLRLDNDLRLAEALAAAVAARTAVVVAPTLAFHHYPAFAGYPGSVSLRADTARDLVVDLVSCLAAYGPRRFYVLNTGVSTRGPLMAAADCLAASGVAMRFTDIEAATAAVEPGLVQQRRGSHADEVETSMMLYLAPERVDMTRARRDDRPRRGPGGFVRTPGAPGIYSPSGTWGDPTLASVDKGQILVEAAVRHVVTELDVLRQ